MAKTLRKGKSDAAAFVRRGGIVRLENEAAKEAVTAVRRQWLAVLQVWLKAGGLAPDVAAAVKSDIRRIRRALGLPPTVAHLRALNRKRVRAYRERQRQAAAERSEPE
jgi:hypothetical protein